MAYNKKKGRRNKNKRANAKWKRGRIGIETDVGNDMTYWGSSPYRSARSYGASKRLARRMGNEYRAGRRYKVKRSNPRTYRSRR